MADKPSISNARVRKNIRAVLKLSHGKPQDESMLLEGVNELVGNGVDLSQLRDGIDWNHEHGYIRREYFDELEMMGWFITSSGIAHENIK